MNPKLEKFLEENKEITLIGLAWALWWRLYVAIMCVSVGFLLIVGIFAQ